MAISPVDRHDFPQNPRADPGTVSSTPATTPAIDIPKGETRLSKLHFLRCHTVDGRNPANHLPPGMYKTL